MENLLKLCAERYRLHRAESHKAFLLHNGADSVDHAAVAHQVLVFLALHRGISTDEAAALIRKHF